MASLRSGSHHDRQTSTSDSGKNDTGELANLTKGQLSGFQKVFQYFDKDRNGAIDIDEIYTQANGLGVELSFDQVRDAIESMSESSELTFKSFLEILTSTDRYMKTLLCDTESTPNEAVMFTVLTKYIDHFMNTSTNNKEAASITRELQGYYAAKANKLRPHVIADYATGHRLIGLTEKQMEGAFLKLRKAKKEEETSPYAMVSKLQLWSDEPRKTQRPRKRDINTESLKCPTRLEDATSSCCTGRDKIREKPTLRYRARKVVLPKLPGVNHVLRPLCTKTELNQTEFNKYTDLVSDAVKRQATLRNQYRGLDATGHWNKLRPMEIPFPKQRRNFSRAFATYSSF